MKKELTQEEQERRRAEADARQAERPTAEDPAEAVTLKGYKASKEYSGKIMLRVPKELHKALAEAAKANGVSLNQYALYKLAK